MSATRTFEEELEELLTRTSVFWFSENVLQTPYSEIKRLIYPRPRYRYFHLQKRSGNLRTIAEPDKRLKEIQLRILDFLKKKCGPSRPVVHGFVEKRSILTNALEHCTPKTHHILNLDLEDFFPSISFYRIRGVLQSRPFNFTHSVATVIAHICTANGALPQGAPTSPFLSNLVCRSLDKDLSDLARRSRAKYTRYADDITFSFSTRTPTGLPQGICSLSPDGRVVLGAELSDIIATKHNFKVNPAKTRLSDRARRMEVTGLTINQRPNVRRVFVDRIRGALHAWDKYGYVAATKKWEAMVSDGKAKPHDERPWKRQTRKRKTPQLRNIIWGKLLFMRMVRGTQDLLYNRLAERYNSLMDRDIGVGPKLPVDPVVRDESGALNAVFVLEWSADYRVNSTRTEMIGGQGTVFAYRRENLLITCAHVLDTEVQLGTSMYPTHYNAPEIENLTLEAVRPHEKKGWAVEVLYKDDQFDIAILRFKDEKPTHRHFLPMDAPMSVRSKGHLIGFPFFKRWNRADVNEQSVLNRTLPHAGMRSFTITGVIRPGYSGGPFVDKDYRLAGMAQRGTYTGQGHDECLCFEIIDAHIRRWEATLSVQVTPAPLPSSVGTNPLIASSTPPP